MEPDGTFMLKFSSTLITNFVLKTKRFSLKTLQPFTIFIAMVF